MVALSPGFTFLAMLCTLTAISKAPLSEAAVLQIRASRPPSMEVASTFVQTRHRAVDHNTLSTDSRADNQEVDKIYAPLLSIPKAADVPPKNKTDSNEDSGSSGSKSDRKSPSDGDSHGKEDVSEGDESKHASHGDKGSVSKEEKAKDKGRRWYLPYPMKQLKDLLGDKMLGDNFVRSPDHHHHHHHHHHGRRRSRMNWRRENELVVSGDNERVIYSRAPHHHSSHGKVVVSGDHDHVHVGRSPHYYHHHHNHHDHHDGHENVIVSGDDDHVHVHRSVSITGEQGQSYIVPHVAKRATAQESFSLSSLGKRNYDIDGAPGHIDIMSPDVDSAEGKRIASLVLAPSESNSSSDNSTTHNMEFVLNASKTNSTQMYLLPTSDDSSPKSTFASDEMGVTIRLAMFDMTSASISPYCATFDPNPPVPAPLTAEECGDEPVGEHRSQLFAFNRVTGVVRPMWFNGQNNGAGPEKGDCSSDAPPTPQNASLAGATEVDANNVTSTPSTGPTRSGNSTVLSADAPQAAPSNSSGSSNSTAQKVALVFVAADPEVLDDVANTTTSSVLATSTGAGASDNVVSTANGSSTTMMASSSPGSLAATSPAVLATASGSSSVSPRVPPTASNAAISAPVSTGTPGSVPPSAAAVSGPNSTPTTVLGVQVVPTAEGSAPSTPSTSVTPVMTPVSTQPYEWMFKPNSRS